MEFQARLVLLWQLSWGSRFQRRLSCRVCWRRVTAASVRSSNAGINERCTNKPMYISCWNQVIWVLVWLFCSCLETGFFFSYSTLLDSEFRTISGVVHHSHLTQRCSMVLGIFVRYPNPCPWSHGGFCRCM